jgi:glycosyltransferase involved in cell wall biosynthesis
LVKSLGKWLIASAVGVFAEDIADGEQGRLVPAGDAPALSAAIAQAVLERPKPKPLPSGVAWASIGHKTRELYQKSRARRERAASPSAAPASGERTP